MFLSLLTKKEKLKFLDLAVYMIDIDGKPTEVEKKLISRIYGEIGREIVEEYTFSKSDSIDDTIDYFKDANQAVKNIVFLKTISPCSISINSISSAPQSKSICFKA